jgi:hypothetical protein
VAAYLREQERIQRHNDVSPPSTINE